MTNQVVFVNVCIYVFHRYSLSINAIIQCYLPRTRWLEEWISVRLASEPKAVKMTTVWLGSYLLLYNTWN